MKRRFIIMLALAGGLLIVPGMFSHAQATAPNEPANAQQKSGGHPAAAQPGAQQPKPQDQGNPFPTDTNNVPVMPSHPTPDEPDNVPADAEGARFSLPGHDADPVASPDDTGGAGSTEDQESSSDVKALDSILPPPGGEDETGKKGRKRSNVLEGPPKESSKEDISVGNYYLDNKNWKGALSRFQSALVLAPDEPDAYWGLAECERHLGDFAGAKANYLKVIEYDPDSKHAKEARKALKEPDIANAKAAAEGQGAQTQQ